jgi:hypothetical protein
MAGTRNRSHIVLCLVRRSSTSGATGGFSVKRKPGRAILATLTFKGRQGLVLPVGAAATRSIRCGRWSTAIRPRHASRICRTCDGCYGIVGLILPTGTIFTDHCRRVKIVTRGTKSTRRTDKAIGVLIFPSQTIAAGAIKDGGRCVCFCSFQTRGPEGAAYGCCIVLRLIFATVAHSAGRGFIAKRIPRLAVGTNGTTERIGRLIHACRASRTSGRFGGVKESFGTILAGATGMATTFLKFTSAARTTYAIDQFSSGRTSGAFVGTIGRARGTRGSRTTAWTIACI